MRTVGALHTELGITQGTVQRVATRPGYGVESVRAWVGQAGIDDRGGPGVGSARTQRVRELEQEVRQPPRANEVLGRAVSFFGAEPNRRYRR